MTKAKPDCTGQKFGMLTVLGKGGKKLHGTRNTNIQLWRLQCECGSIIEIPRGYFEINKQISCGCKRRRNMVDNNRKPANIAGQRFGTLTAVRLTGKKDKYGKPTWLFQCDCGSYWEQSLTIIRAYQWNGTRINCKNRINHPDRWLVYPPTPNPYPPEAGLLLTKYLPLTELPHKKINSAVEDERRDRLIRGAWIVAYRRSQGEHISELHESRLIKKHLRYCSIKVFWNKTLENFGGMVYDVSHKKKQIGNQVTNLTRDDYPTLELEVKGNTILSKNNKKLKFKRC